MIHTWETGSGVQDHPWLPNKFEVSLNYTKLSLSIDTQLEDVSSSNPSIPSTSLSFQCCRHLEVLGTGSNTMPRCCKYGGEA